MTQARRRQLLSRRRRLLTGAFSAAVHAAAIGFLLFVHADTTMQVADVEPIPVVLAPPPEPLKPPEPPAPPSEKPPTPAPPPSLHARIARVRPPPDVQPLPATKGKPTPAPAPEVSDAELASATTADSGEGGGRACNMTRWLQAALRKDPLVQTAMANAHSPRPLLVWNGAWIRHGEEDGAGLAAVREAIMWEVGFAPVACRNEPVRGLVLLSLNDAPGASRVVLGSGQWRWSDLLAARHATANP